MKRARWWCLAVVVAVLLIGQVTPVQAQGAFAPAAAADCQFILGFATLKALIDAAEGPEKVGNCLENERFNPQNGEARQHTTGGLLVWRKADNWTAFTDGYRTWANGPYGLQTRLNTEEFSWERPAPTTLYWTDARTRKIQRANLDGSQVEDVLAGMVLPTRLALDVAAGKLYWVDAGIRGDAGTGRIQRANLDGSQVEDVLTGLDDPGSLALDVAAGKLYWVDDGHSERGEHGKNSAGQPGRLAGGRRADRPGRSRRSRAGRGGGQIVLGGRGHSERGGHGENPAGQPGRLARWKTC